MSYRRYATGMEDRPLPSTCFRRVTSPHDSAGTLVEPAAHVPGSTAGFRRVVLDGTVRRKTRCTWQAESAVPMRACCYALPKPSSQRLGHDGTSCIQIDPACAESADVSGRAGWARHSGSLLSVQRGN